jgi:hypothetical protein
MKKKKTNCPWKWYEYPHHAFKKNISCISRMLLHTSCGSYYYLPDNIWNFNRIENTNDNTDDLPF